MGHERVSSAEYIIKALLVEQESDRTSDTTPQRVSAGPGKDKGFIQLCVFSGSLGYQMATAYVLIIMMILEEWTKEKNKIRTAVREFLTCRN